MALKNYDSAGGPGMMLAVDHANKFPTERGRNFPRQGTLYIQASTKKEAAERLSRMGYPWMKPNDLRVGMGNPLDALAEAGLMDTGDLFIVADYGHVVRVSHLDGKAVYLGRIVSKPIFVPAEGSE